MLQDVGSGLGVRQVQGWDLGWDLGSCGLGWTKECTSVEAEMEESRGFSIQREFSCGFGLETITGGFSCRREELPLGKTEISCSAPSVRTENPD